VAVLGQLVQRAQDHVVEAAAQREAPGGRARSIRGHRQGRQSSAGWGRTPSQHRALGLPVGHAGDLQRGSPAHQLVDQDAERIDVTASRHGAAQPLLGSRGAQREHPRLYLRRTDDDLTLTIEHRAAPSHGPISIRLVAHAAALALTADPAPFSPPSTAAEPTSTPAQCIEAALADPDLETAATLDDLRRACHMRTQSLCDALAELVRAGRVVKSAAGYRLA
jgi:hypothetical protein